LKLHPERGDALSLSADETEAIVRLIQESSEHLWNVCEAQGFVSQRGGVSGSSEQFEQARHFRSVFSSQADCQRLRNGLLARMAEGARKDSA